MGVSALKLKKRRFREDNTPVMIAPVVCEIKLEGDVDPAAVVAAFKVSKDFCSNYKQEIQLDLTLNVLNVRFPSFSVQFQ